MRDDREKLRDILEAIERINKYAVQGRQSFEHNELIKNRIQESGVRSQNEKLSRIRCSFTAIFRMKLKLTREA